MQESLQQLPQSDLISCWCFEENSNNFCYNTDNSMAKLPLQEINGPIERVINCPGSIFGEQSAYLQPGQYFQLDRNKLGPLNCFGKKTEFTILAVIFRNYSASSD